MSVSRRLLVPLCAGLFAGLICFAPIEMLLRATGLADSDITWRDAEGSILRGRIEGLRVQGRDFGEMNLRLRPASMLTGHVGYAVTLNGKRGSGTADLSLGLGHTFRIQNYQITTLLEDFPDAAAWLRRSGGSIRLEGTVISLKRGSCVAAEGVATSDLLFRNAAWLGSGWPELRGEIACEAGALVVPLASRHPSGLTLAARVTLAQDAPARFVARLDGTLPPDLQLALPALGFLPSGAGYEYSFQPQPSRVFP